MSEGYIYLRRQTGHGYCFGKTNDIARRDREYRKENPWIKNVSHFFTHDMTAAENWIANASAHLRLFSNSREWLCESDEVLQLFLVARRHWKVSDGFIDATHVQSMAEKAAKIAEEKAENARSASLKELRWRHSDLKEELKKAESQFGLTCADINRYEEILSKPIKSASAAYSEDRLVLLLTAPISGFLVFFLAGSLSQSPEIGCIAGIVACFGAFFFAKGPNMESRQRAIKNNPEYAKTLEQLKAKKPILESKIGKCRAEIKEVAELEKQALQQYPEWRPQ